MEATCTQSLCNQPDTKKMPLGKLSKGQIAKGFAVSRMGGEGVCVCFSGIIGVGWRGGSYLELLE